MPYAATPGRATAQLVVDVCVVLWVAMWIVVGRFVHAAIASFAEVGRRVESGAGGISSNLGKAGDTAARVPLVGDALRSPLRAAGSAAGDIAAAGQGLQDKATWLSVVLALAVAVPPILGVVLPWFALRFRFARRAGAAAELAAHGRRRAPARAPRAGEPARCRGSSSSTRTRWRPGAATTRRWWPGWRRWSCARPASGCRAAWPPRRRDQPRGLLGRSGRRR
jgi:hypothetical protein